MNEPQKKSILHKSKIWFRETIAKQHVINTRKLANPKKFHINPFLVNYLANFLTGDGSPESIAKALIYPRILGTSITTSFGTNIQRFATDVLDGFGSGISGLDIEFVDQLDGRRKYCQLKAGPNTINKDDVETISGHFDSIRNLARTNNLSIGLNDLIVGVLYGSEDELSGHYKRLTNQYFYPIYIGQGFWHRLTGDSGFYHELIDEFAVVANEFDGSKVIHETIQALAKSDTIQDLAIRIKTSSAHNKS